MNFRKDLGFRADAPYVRRLAEAPAQLGSTSFLGSLFTSSEVDELLVRMDLMDSFKAVREWAEDAAPDTFGGLYVDHLDGGVLKVKFTGNAENRRAVLEGLVPHPERLVLTSVDRSLASLVEQQVRVDLASPELVKQGVHITSTSVSERENRLEVSLLADEEVELARSVLGWDVFLSVAPFAQTSHTRSGTRDIARDRAFSPLQGGLHLRADTGDNYATRCTSGFVARSGASRWLLTAGHCFDVAENVFQGYVSGSGSNYVYRRLNRIDGNRRCYGDDTNCPTTQSDGEAVAIPSSLSSRLVYFHANDFAHVIRRMQSTSGDGGGGFVCIAGVRNPGISTDGGGHCGYIIDRYFTVRYADGTTVNNMRVATYPQTSGDSGAPIFETDQAKGLHSGSRDSDGRALYTHIDRIIRDLGLDGLVLG